MKKYSKILLILLSLTLILALAACNPQDDTPPDGNGPPDFEVSYYTVTFDSDGGTKIDPIKDVEFGTAISEPAPPTKRGYIFEYWQLDSNRYDFSSGVEGNITLTAKWTPMTFDHDLVLYEDPSYADYVSFKDDKGNDITTLTSVYDSKDQQFGIPKINNPNDPGDYFVYWYYYEKNDAEHKNPIRFSEWAAKDAESVAPDSVYNKLEELTLYAMWHSKLADVSVTFADSKSDEVYYTHTYKLHDAVLKPATPVKDGYKFDGWYYEVEEEEEGEKVTKQIDFIFDDPSSKDDAPDTLDKNTTLYARWIKVISVTDVNGLKSLAQLMNDTSADRAAEREEARKAHIFIAGDIDAGGQLLKPIFPSSAPFEGEINGKVNADGTESDSVRTISNAVIEGFDHVSLFGAVNGKIINLNLKNITLRLIPENGAFARTAYVAPFVSVSSGGNLTGLNAQNISYVSQIPSDMTPVLSQFSPMFSTGEIIAGGIVALNEKGQMDSCVFNGAGAVAFEAERLAIGGLAGKNVAGIIQNSSVTNFGVISYAKNDGNGSNGEAVSYIGGICGLSEGGSVYRTKVVNSTDIIESRNSDNAAYLGGIAGRASGTSVSQCYAELGIIASAAQAYAGGVTGYNGGTVSDCYTNCDIKAVGTLSSAYAGGIAGYAETFPSGRIGLCYSLGSVAAESAAENVVIGAGGIAGAAFNNTIEKCFSAAQVSAKRFRKDSLPSGRAYLGLLAGRIKGEQAFTNCYYQIDGVLTLDGEQYTVTDETPNFDATVKGSAANESDFKSAEWLTKYAGFPLNGEKDAWSHTEGGYPTLKWIA